MCLNILRGVSISLGEDTQVWGASEPVTHNCTLPPKPHLEAQVSVGSRESQRLYVSKDSVSSLWSRSKLHKNNEQNWSISKSQCVSFCRHELKLPNFSGLSRVGVVAPFCPRPRARKGTLEWMKMCLVLH